LLFLVNDAIVGEMLVGIAEVRVTIIKRDDFRDRRARIMELNLARGEQEQTRKRETPGTR